MKVSLISTVLNDARSLPTLLDSIAAQTRQPDEVVICDGGSTDGTLALLRNEKRFPLRVIERPRANISQGRNAASEAAAGEVIASADAGVRLDPQWLEKLMAQITPTQLRQLHPESSTSPATNSASQGRAVVGGFFLPEVHTPFEVAM